MTDQAIDIPLTRGLGQQVDPKLMPQGVLKRAENVRWRKDGRIGKRRGTTLLTAPPNTGPTHGLYSDQGHGVCAANGRYSARSATGAWATLGFVSRFLPERELLAFSTSGQTIRGGVCALSGDYLGVACVDTSNNLLYVRVYEQSSGTLVFRTEIVPIGTLGEVRVVATTGRLIFLHIDGTALKQATFATATLSMAAVATVVATVVPGGGFDASEFTGGANYLLVCQATATTLTVLLRSGSAGTTVASATVTTASDTCSAAIADCTERVYVAWFELAGHKVRAMSLTTGLASPSATVDLDSSISSAPMPHPVICRADATNSYVFWSQWLPSRAMKYRTVSDAAALGTMQTFAALGHASKPWIIAGQPYLWTSQGELEEIDLTYHLVSLDPTYATAESGTFMVHLSAAEHRSCSFFGDIPSNVFATSDGGYVTGFPVITSRALESSLFRGYSVFAFTRGGMTQLESRQFATERDTVYVSGGKLAYSDGSECATLGFAGVPLIVSATPSNGAGTLTSSKTYGYVATYEFVDARGQRHQSAPSAPVLQLLGAADDTVDLVIRGVTLFQNGNYSSLSLFSPTQPLLVLWRTLADGSIYYRLPSSSMTDVYPDTAIASNEVLYVQGGILPNDPPPSCKYIAVGSERALVAGLWDPTAYQFSKISFPGAPLQFADDPAFRGNVPGAITGIATLDDVWVIFTADSIFLVTGDGPDDQGNGQFSPPRRLPVQTGCIDVRSILPTSGGIVFQGSNGLQLLGRGFDAPSLIQGIEDVLETYPIVTSAVLVTEHDESLARFTLNDADPATTGAVLTLDIRRNIWAVDTLGPLASSAVWEGSWAAVTDDTSDVVSIVQENPGGFGELGLAYVSSLLELGDLRPFGVQGRGLVRRIHVLGEYRGPCKVKAEASYDGGVSYTDSVTWNLTGLVAGAQVRREWQLSRIQIDNVRFRLSDIDLSGPSEGFAFNALSVHVERKRGLRRRPPGER